MHGVLHIAQDLQEPIRNRTRLSRTREDLIHATGSRYSPASVCNGLGLVESAPGACVVVGKPSEIAAVHNARQLRCQLDQKIGLTLSFFCAESPATLGTIALLKKMGIGAEALSSLRYRGEGWPGHFAPVRKGEPKPTQEMSYQESWAFLQAYRPWSVQLWPDATGELADISCGDPWYRKPDGANPGSSLVMARTERGQRIVLGAIKSGYLKLRPAEAWKLEKSQSGLLEKKASIWGRRLAMRLFGLPVTSLQGVNLLHCWLRLPLNERIRSIFGTARRILLKKLYRRGKIKSLSEPVMRAVPSDQSVGASPPNFVVRSFEDEN
ncbi:MAG TPA: Coenzyme F420 hydrogenase/dehydrogenase, beta subunit C-terminal domain [Candidatus Dormibacteraeota bacterium]|nr:Coenzyme F420 hydrogenase/dehydrogenase, beta subunit C-terminal domain [Candidatus Dormibacteraeota bacterium]